MNEDNLKAPDEEVILSDSSEKRLSDLWKDRLLVLVFLRHFG
jgi:hypothetical protein